MLIKIALRSLGQFFKIDITLANENFSLVFSSIPS